jgi:hypothetical protein
MSVRAANFVFTLQMGPELNRAFSPFELPPRGRCRMTNWLPLVDALRTFLLAPTPELRGTVNGA